MYSGPALGIRLHGGQTAASAVEMARAADAAGLAGLWFAENAFARGSLPVAAACAVATARVAIGAGVFNPFSRHPTMMAMEVGALDELSGGRASISVGSGIAVAVRQIGANADKPLGALRDTLTILRGLLNGERVSHAGRAFSADGVRLDFAPRSGIAVHLAGRGPLTLGLAGELADGLVISNMCAPGYTRVAAARVQAARATAGRPGAPRIIQYMPCAIGDGAVERARQAVGAMVPGYWALSRRVASVSDGLFADTGIGEAEFAIAAARIGAGEDAATVLDQRFTDAFCLAGSPRDVLEQAARFAATDIALTFAGPMALDEISALGAALSSGSPD